MCKKAFKRLLAVLIVFSFFFGAVPMICVGEDGSISFEMMNTPVSVEVWAADDALQSVATLNASSGSLSDYVSINSNYSITGYAEITATSSGTEISDYISSPANWPSYFANGGSANKHYFSVIDDPAWTATSGKVTSEKISYTVLGDEWTAECSKSGNTRGTSKINSKVLQIYAKKTVTLSFDYSASMSTTSGVGSNSKASSYYYYLITNSESPSLSDLKGSSAVCVADGSSASISSTNYSLTVDEGKYLYLYFFGYFDSGDCTSDQNSNKTWTCSYSASISNVKVTPQTSNYSLIVGCIDSADNMIGRGTLKNGTSTYPIPSTGYMKALDNVSGGTRVTLTVSGIPTGDYIHIGWRNKTLETDIYDYTYSFSLDSDMEVYALFVPVVTVTMGSNGYSDANYSYKTPAGGTASGANQFVARNSGATKFYKTLSAAFSDTDVVVLIGNITLNGDFTIPTGKTLSVPWDLKDAATVTLQKDSSNTTPSVYTKATINGTVTLNGNLVASGRQSNAQNAHGKSTGKIGQLIIGATGQINVGSTGKVFAYGIITGSGHVSVASGGEVYELMEIRDIRALQAMLDAAKLHEKAMAFSQFFIKSNEVATTYNNGAKLLAYYHVNLNNIQSSGIAPVVGPYSTTASQMSMYMVNAGSLTKSFSAAAPYNNKIIISADSGSDIRTGKFSVSITMSGQTATIDTGSYYMPISYAYALEVKNGGKFTFNHNYKFLPGSAIDVEEGGTLEISSGKNLVLYRANDYDYRRPGSDSAQGFSGGGYPVSFTKITGISYASNTEANIGSAKLNVDGSINALGGLYVTNQLTGNTSYSNGYTFLTGTGTINLSGALANGTIYEEKQKGTGITDSSCTTVEIAYVPIKGITNDEATADNGQTDYNSFGTGTYYGWVNDSNVNVWTTSRPVTLSYDANGGSGATASSKKSGGSSFTAAANAFTAPSGAQFICWNTESDGSGTDYAQGAELTLNEDTTLYAQWGYAVTFDLNGAQLAEIPQQLVRTGAKVQQPTLAEWEDRTFLGWYNGDQLWRFEEDTVTQNLTLTAHWGATITWMIDGEATTEEYELGTTPSHTAPVKESDGQYNYSFTGWDPEITTVTGPATYTAQFEAVSAGKTYRFNWIDTQANGGKGDFLLQQEAATINELEQPIIRSYLGYHFKSWTVWICGEEVFTLNQQYQTSQYQPIATGDSFIGPSEDELKVTRENLIAMIRQLLPENDDSVIEIDLFANYEANSEEYSVKVVYDVPGADGAETVSKANVVKGKFMHLTAEAEYNYNGTTYYFDHWEYNGNSIKSADILAKPTAANENDPVTGQKTVVVLHAVYTAEQGTPNELPAVYVSNHFAENINGVRKVSATMVYAIPAAAQSKITVTEYGFVYCLDPENKYGFYNEKTKGHDPSGEADGIYTLHIAFNNEAKLGVPLRFTPYVKYTVNGGEVQTRYGEPVTKSWNELAEEGVVQG